MDTILAQSIMAEMTEEYRQAALHFASLKSWGAALGKGLEFIVHDQALAELSMATWRRAIEIVAKQADINLIWETKYYRGGDKDLTGQRVSQ